MASLPRTLVTTVSSISAAQGDLVSGEAHLLEGVNVARQRELMAGRTLARRTMVEMGWPVGPVGQNPDGSPTWPAGLCGSIAHSHHDIAVAMALLSDVQAVGIDIEDGRDLDAATSDIVSEREIEEVVDHPLGGSRDGSVRLLFSMKEAVFKCQAPLTGNMALDFREVRLVRRPDNSFGAEAAGGLEQSTPDVIPHICIEMQRIQGVVVATAWLPRAKLKIV